MGKGSGRRPTLVPETQAAENWERAFGKSRASEQEVYESGPPAFRTRVRPGYFSGFLRESANGHHKRVQDFLTKDGPIVCVCLDCMKAWWEGGNCGGCDTNEEDLSEGGQIIVDYDEYRRLQRIENALLTSAGPSGKLTEEQIIELRAFAETLK